MSVGQKNREVKLILGRVAKERSGQADSRGLPRHPPLAEQRVATRLPRLPAVTRKSVFVEGDAVHRQGEADQAEVPAGVPDRVGPQLSVDRETIPRSARSFHTFCSTILSSRRVKRSMNRIPSKVEPSRASPLNVPNA